MLEGNKCRVYGMQNHKCNIKNYKACVKPQRLSMYVLHKTTIYNYVPN